VGPNGITQFEYRHRTAYNYKCFVFTSIGFAACAPRHNTVRFAACAPRHNTVRTPSAATPTYKFLPFIAITFLKPSLTLSSDYYQHHNLFFFTSSSSSSSSSSPHHPPLLLCLPMAYCLSIFSRHLCSNTM